MPRASLRSDPELVRGIASRDTTCLDELYARYALAVFSLAFRIGRDRAIAEDATQDVFIQVWRDGIRYDIERGTVRAWLLTITRGRALDRLRAQQTRNTRSSPVETADSGGLRDPTSSPETSAAASQQTALVETVLRVLAPADRRVIELAYFEGLTHAEIAARLDQPLGTIKTQIRRTLALLRSALAEQPRPAFAWAGRPSSNPAAPGAGGSLRNRSVLVVDDDADTLKLLTLVLQRAGATVVGASSAAQALRRLDVMWPDLLVTDLDMPEEDGYALLQHVQDRADARGRGLPSVAFSAHSSEQERKRTTRAGFDLHLAKPVLPSVLVTRVAELFSISRPAAPACYPGG
jgi:RNA polymerase sigma-70 factor (ECF subfamily)